MGQLTLKQRLIPMVQFRGASPVAGSKSRIQFCCRPDADWNHRPGNLASMGTPVVVRTPPKGWQVAFRTTALVGLVAKIGLPMWSVGMDDMTPLSMRAK